MGVESTIGYSRGRELQKRKEIFQMKRDIDGGPKQRNAAVMREKFFLSSLENTCEKPMRGGKWGGEGKEIKRGNHWENHKMGVKLSINEKTKLHKGGRGQFWGRGTGWGKKKI